MSVGFTIIRSEGSARRGVLATAHGSVQTPAFMPVGTAATVKALTVEQIRATGAEMVLCNTYHLMLRPGTARIAALGGLHRFMNWSAPILTDSGGYQVMSLASLRQVNEHGVTFQSHVDGSRHELTPERCIVLQRELGVDIAMVLDECMAYPVAAEDAAESMRLSMRWAARCRAAFEDKPGYGLFGIVQGSVFPELRRESVERLTAIGFDGCAVGGLAVGEGQDQMFAVLDATVPHLPGDRPHYLMGVGKPDDIVGAVERGIDLFDCVLPTRSGRTGQAFTWDGPINLRNARFADERRPLDDTSACPASRHYSRAYLHHLVKAKEILASVLLTWHNVHFYQELMRRLRLAIEQGRLPAFAAEFRQRYRADVSLPGA
ncbi:MAG: tRNA guanosine(34) transglycosylase Tgt [Alphaproteobacteria bacterium]|nr:tRNA guanosine(34) transglycosylase Tgt [Alphaproteobacteria bacterium]